MPAVIYQKTPGALIPQPGRTVATFSSGLVRVDQSFICPTTDEETHRAALVVGGEFPGDQSPSLTGLKIFPEPQENRRGDGFTEFKLSGYGSTIEGGRNVKYSQRTYTHTFIYNTLAPDYESSPLFGTGTLIVIFTLQDIRGEIVGKLTNGGAINLEIPLEELDVISMSASAGWTLESLTNDFISTTSPGHIYAVFRWKDINVDGSFSRVRLTVSVSAVGWTVESSRSYGDVGEFVVTGTREIKPLDYIDLEKA
jgi:hypothetical protein